MMNFPIIYSPEFLDHDTGNGHPERAARLEAIVSALKDASWRDRLNWLTPTPVEKRADLMPLMNRIHAPTYLDRVKHIASRGGGSLDADTIVSSRSYDVALLAVSAWLDGIDTLSRNSQPVFVLARPPGHHALRDRGMGFCLFANAAIAAEYALQKIEIDRVAIFDWDVHHGNGTQAIVETNPQIAYCSIHQSPAYPGTGAATERGASANVLNLPIPPQTGSAEYQRIFIDRVIPFLVDFNPDLIILSAGYDAHSDDPLAEIYLQSTDYFQIIKKLLRITGRLLIGLEGGYDLPAIAASVVATIDGCITTLEGREA
jgi:acetoin utilization deacetylase AcuC-like enzyme